MTPGERARCILEGMHNDRRLAGLVQTGNLGRLVNAQPGLRAATTDGTGHGPDIADPTGEAVDRPDQPVHDIDNLDRALRAWFVEGDKVCRILSNYGPARPAGEADRLALRRANTRAEPCCVECATITEPHSDLPLDIPPDPRRKGPTDVAGRLPTPMLLCAWHVNFVEDHNRLPSEREMIEHRDTGRVRVRADQSTTRRPA